MRILLVCSRFPWPPRRGNQVRTVQWLEALAEDQVTVVCPAPVGEPAPRSGSVTCWRADSPAGRIVSFARTASAGRPFQEALYDSGDARRVVASLLCEGRYDLVVVQMVRCGWAADLARRLAHPPPVLFDAIDAMGMHFDRAADAAAGWAAPLFRVESERCRRRERGLAGVAAATVAVAERDLREVSPPAGRGRVVPVAGRPVSKRDNGRAEPVVLLSGNLGYRPTVAAARWFAAEVWPAVRSRVPDARWVLAGARPSGAVRRLAGCDGIELHADVPDLGPFVSSARVAVAPMSAGSGVPMKVLEAMAAGVPVVADSWAAAGLAAEAAGAVVVAEQPSDWVEAVSRLLADEEAARDQGALGQAVWERHYHPDVVAGQVRAAVAEAVGSAAAS